MSTTDRFPLLAALLIEKSITPLEIAELQEMGLAIAPVSVTNPDHIASILQQTMNTATPYDYYVPGTMKVAKTLSFIDLTYTKKCRHLNEMQSREFKMQFPIHSPEDSFDADVYDFVLPDEKPLLRSIDTHRISEQPEPLKIFAVGEPSAAGKPTRYLVEGFYDNTRTTDKQEKLVILMQDSKPVLRRPNGITIETLLAIAADQLECLQAGPFPCDENQEALWDIQNALLRLKVRSESRLQQGVSGKQVKHVTSRSESMKPWVPKRKTDFENKEEVGNVETPVENADSQ